MTCLRFSLQECCYDARGGVQVPYPAFTPSIVVVFRGCEISVEVVRLRYAEASLLRLVRGNVPKCCEAAPSGGTLRFPSPFSLERSEELIAIPHGALHECVAKQMSIEQDWCNAAGGFDAQGRVPPYNF